MSSNLSNQKYFVVSLFDVFMIKRNYSRDYSRNCRCPEYSEWYVEYRAQIEKSLVCVVCVVCVKFCMVSRIFHVQKAKSEKRKKKKNFL